jgi:DNA adenine methylase
MSVRGDLLYHYYGVNPMINPMEQIVGGIKAPISRVGGKRLLKKRIIKEFPDNYEEMTYVEPFIGGGSVFYTKNPSVKEVINDLDKVIYTIHKGLQQHGKEIGDKLMGQYSQAEFWRIERKNPTTLLGRLTQFLLLNRLSFMGQGERPNKNRMNFKANFAPYEERLKDTTITNKDYKTVMKEHDSPNTLFYLDPPYEGSNKQHYDHPEFDLDDLHAFLKTLKGKWILSMNDSPNVRKIFRGLPTKTVETCYVLPSPHKVKEVIIKNY